MLLFNWGLVPKLAMTGRANTRFFFHAASRYPLVVTPLAPKSHHCDRHPSQKRSLLVAGVQCPKKLICQYALTNQY
jgi:hypothetical protein